MSAPDTNVEKQKRRHKGPLLGIGIGVALVAVLFLVFMSGVLSPENEGLEGVVTDEPAISE